MTTQSFSPSSSSPRPRASPSNKSTRCWRSLRPVTHASGSPTAPSLVTCILLRSTLKFLSRTSVESMRHLLFKQRCVVGGLRTLYGMVYVE